MSCVRTVHSCQKLEQLSDIKDRVLATTSHELRTPLNGILGNAIILQETSLNEEQAGYMASAASKRASLTYECRLMLH